jgi:hypothetical protein
MERRRGAFQPKGHLWLRLSNANVRDKKGDFVSGLLLRACQYALLVAGFGLVGYCALALTEAHLYQGTEERAFDEVTRSTTSRFAKRVAPAIRHNVLGKIAIPQVGISAMIAEGDDHRTLMGAVGLEMPCWPRIAIPFSVRCARFARAPQSN